MGTYRNGMFTTSGIKQSLLGEAPPRALPPMLWYALLLEYLGAHPTRSYLDPVLLNAGIAALAMVLLSLPWPFWVLLMSIVVVRLGDNTWHAVASIRSNLSLLKHGHVVQAQVWSIRPCEDEPVGGVYVDCLIPTATRRSSVGSVCLTSAAEAERLKERGYVAVLCQVEVPGTWILLEEQPAADPVLS